MEEAHFFLANLINHPEVDVPEEPLQGDGMVPLRLVLNVHAPGDVPDGRRVS